MPKTLFAALLLLAGLWLTPASATEQKRPPAPSESPTQSPADATDAKDEGKKWQESDESEEVGALAPILQKLGVGPKELKALSIHPHLGHPVEVDVGMQIISIPGIDESGESYSIHGRIDLGWRDPRLASAERTETVQFREDEATLLLDYLWWPDVSFHNGLGEAEHKNRSLILEPNGEMRLYLSVDSEFTYTSDLRYMPFDIQTLPIVVESFGANPGWVMLKPSAERSGYEDAPPDWRITDFRTAHHIKDADHAGGKTSQAHFELRIQRHGDYYIWRVMFPIVLVVIVTWWMLWFSPSQFEARLQMGIVGILTLVAFNMSLMDSIPNIPYLTVMDLFYLNGLVAIFIATAESLLVYNYHERGLDARALRIDRIMRLMLPLLTFGGWSVLLTLATL
ncbi:hypothetical protein [Magnetofaba australis]|uniref:Putative neurotransmitter-gated ion-channel ligand-binding protein n=1 Tax=Magnetofaba australis IT-1 TaxID=1434232 RepID=A0A1Y2K184_9PROT|nr:hypothetical protein [Magnetofaba australis]OSM01791.1 putative neurotransmitter-gated ion-channel ligand-binding protein [Magnetofaba australis IT-1]